MLRRRDILVLAASAASGSGFAVPRRTRLVAAWERSGRYEVGMLEAQDTGLRRLDALEVPTRAHGLLRGPDGSLLAVARRPGDWIVRWHPGHAAAASWTWIEDGAHFNGHACSSHDGRWLFTCETDTDSGAGRIGVRDARSLRKLREWATHGIDPHELLLDAKGDLWVANGGILTAQETGRAKLQLDRMDSSLVCLDAGTGAPKGQWRLEDARLSLRHLAWGRWAGRPALGIALQAQHDAETLRKAAPVLALWQDGELRVVAPGGALAGYGGDIAFAGGRFAVSCPRADGVALFAPGDAAPRFIALADACALGGDPLWAGGSTAALAWPAVGPGLTLEALRLDNHWLVQA